MSLRRLLLPPAVEITGDSTSQVLLEGRLVSADGSLVTAIHLSGGGALSGTSTLAGTKPYRWLLGNAVQETLIIPTDELVPQTWYQFVFHLQSGTEIRTCTIPSLEEGASDPLPLAEALFGP